jgi:hypothetical protein
MDSYMVMENWSFNARTTLTEWIYSFHSATAHTGSRAAISAASDSD